MHCQTVEKVWVVAFILSYSGLCRTGMSGTFSEEFLGGVISDLYIQAIKIIMTFVILFYKAQRSSFHCKTHDKT